MPPHLPSTLTAVARAATRSSRSSRLASRPSVFLAVCGRWSLGARTGPGNPSSAGGVWRKLRLPAATTSFVPLLPPLVPAPSSSSRIGLYCSSVCLSSPFFASSLLPLLRRQHIFQRLCFSAARHCSTHSASASATMASDRDILPGNFKPSHYNLAVTDLDFSSWSYKGTVSIRGALTAPTSEIILNTVEIDVDAATLTTEATKGSRRDTALQTTYDVKNQRCTLAFVPGGGDPVSPTAAATLDISFRGRLNHDLAGFYRSQYKPPAGSTPSASTPRDADFHYMLSTQFESCDARRAFPCFDEPNLKATFDFAIEIPADLVALSNMPVQEETSVDGKPNTKRVAFTRTPIMSTYLLAWAVGDFEYIEAFTDRRYVGGQQIPVRVYTTRGLKEQGRWALEHAPKYIDFYSERFDIDYPLPKSDILAVSEFTHGAMENWGLVTYRTTAILFDEELSDNRFRNRIAYVVAHELAHQWFGNLVTMDWWDELWLNEGFATWAGWLATEHLHPDWDVWAQFVNEGMERALKLDSLRSSHPIQVPVRDALDVNQVFDAISYLKGCSVIRMLANHLGTDTFLRGVSDYLKNHKYGNAKTTALWNALSAASGQDINTLMGPWIEKIGFPVLTVEEKPGASELVIQQSRFLSTGDVKPEEDTTTWWLPLALAGRSGSASGTIESVALTQKKDTLTNVDEAFYKLNTDATGFYRVNYTPQRLGTLGKQLDRLSVSDKISIAGSTAELAFAGNASTANLLTFLEGFRSETHVRVLGQALDAIQTIKSIFGADETIRKGMEAFTLKLIAKPLEAVSFDVVEKDFNKAELRKRLLTTAVRNDHPVISKEALRRFDAYIRDPVANPVKGDIRGPVFLSAIKADAARSVPLLIKEWKTTTAPDGRDMALIAMSATADPAVVRDLLLPFLFGDGADTVPVGDMHTLSAGLANRTLVRPLLWQYVQDEWSGTVAKKLGGNPILLDRFVGVTLNKFSDTQSLAEIVNFFADKETKAFDRTLETVKDSIRGRAAYRARDAEALGTWLKERAYVQ